MVSSADMSAPHTSKCPEQPHISPEQPHISPDMLKKVGWRFGNCICARIQIDEYMRNGVRTDHLSQELQGWGHLQGLHCLRKKLEYFKTIPYYAFTQGVNEGVCEGQAEVEKMMSSVLHMLSQIEQEILHLEKSVDLDVVKSILAKHQVNPEPDFTDAEHLLVQNNALPYDERVKRRSEVRDSITKTLIARKAWKGEGYLPHTLKCETDILCGRFCD